MVAADVLIDPSAHGHTVAVNHANPLRNFVDALHFAVVLGSPGMTISPGTVLSGEAWSDAFTRAVGGLTPRVGRAADRGVRAKEYVDPWGERAPQLALARFLDDGRFAVHLRRSAAVYAERRAAVLAALDLLPDLRVLSAEAGLHVTVACGRDLLHLDHVVASCASDGVVVRALHRIAAPLGRYAGPTGLAVGYGAIATSDIAPAVALLGRHLAA